MVSPPGEGDVENSDPGDLVDDAPRRLLVDLGGVPLRDLVQHVAVIATQVADVGQLEHPEQGNPHLQRVLDQPLDLADQREVPPGRRLVELRQQRPEELADGLQGAAGGAAPGERFERCEIVRGIDELGEDGCGLSRHPDARAVAAGEDDPIGTVEA